MNDEHPNQEAQLNDEAEDDAHLQSGNERDQEVCLKASQGPAYFFFFFFVFLSRSLLQSFPSLKRRNHDFRCPEFSMTRSPNPKSIRGFAKPMAPLRHIAEYKANLVGDDPFVLLHSSRLLMTRMRKSLLRKHSMKIEPMVKRICRV